MGEAEEGACAVYDVFINHRGLDTKGNVASLIHGRLVNYGLQVFLDRDELERGDSISDKIESAIKSSSVHVAIFSKRYAQSAWCLNELLEMLKSRSGGRCKIIPIFYKVKPEDLRRIKDDGPYAKAFLKHQNEGRHKGDLVQRWKEALKDASGISGTVFKKKDDLRVLVEEIVEKVLKEAKRELLHVAEHPVGLHQATKDFNTFLEERQLSGTTVVGIIGLDGSGKSTLVKQLYNYNLQSRKFKRYCFLSEFNEKYLAVLQQKMVRDLLGEDKYSISDTSQGKRRLQVCLKQCGPVLIVLDGLDKEEQIESLLSVVKKDVLADGSLILVTCHDKALLEAHQVNLFYQVNLLQGKDARDLFCSYALHMPKPPPHLEDLVEKFVKNCCGFPFALKVLGRKLYRKQDRTHWEKQLKDLSKQELPSEIVDKILKVSYNNLEEREKEVFLDVAHFLVGEDTGLAMKVLEGLYDSDLNFLEELREKCLLDLEEIEPCKRPFAKGHGIQWRTKGRSKIRMHDLVRKMARQIASGHSGSSLATKPLRLCRLDNKSILPQGQSGVCHVRGIRYEYIDEPERQDQDIKESQLPRPQWPLTQGLRLLVLHDFGVPFPSNRLFGDLIWLRMHKSNWGNTIPSTLLLRNLRVLELDGVNFEALDRMDGDKFPSKLGELTVDYCGESAKIPERNLPSSSRVDKNSMEASSSASGSVWDWFRFRQLKDLVKMVLKNVKGLKSLPIDFKALRNLRHLDLSGWSDLEKMPDSFTGLSQLQYLAFQDCRNLSISDFGEIALLEYLDFEGCRLLRMLPDKTTAQRGLRYLNLMGTSIEELPEDIGNLINVEQLLIKSPSFIGLPRSVYKLGQLRILSLSRSSYRHGISGSSSISNYNSRRNSKVERNFDIISISREKFPYLESLQLWDVDVVPQGIACSSVKVLHVNSRDLKCFSFERDQGKLPLDRSHGQGSTADGTKSVGATDHNPVSPLTELRLVDTKISSLCIPRESLFPDLEIVDLSNSFKLGQVHSLPSNLRRLYLTNCPSLTTLPRFSNLACLRILDISRCHNLKALNLEGLSSIEEIAAEECWKLQSIRGLAQLHTLSYLNVSTSNEVPNSTIWSDILGFPSNVSTVMLGGANVLCMNAEEMDSIKQSILEKFQGTTIIDIPTMENFQRVQLRNMELYEAILLCFIAKNNFLGFRVSVGDNVYNIRRPNFVNRHEESPWLYTFMWSQNSNLFKDLTFHGKSVLDCTIELAYGHSGTLNESFREAWIVMIKNRTDGVEICKQLFKFLCCIPKQGVHQAVAF